MTTAPATGRSSALPHHTPHTPFPRVAAVAVALAALVTVVVLAFAWPAVTAETKDVPVAVAGPEQAVSAVEPMLAQQAGDLLDLTTVADRDTAVEAIQRRDVVGAVVLGPEPELLTASAAGTVSQVVGRLADPLQAAVDAQSPGTTLTVTDVVPYSADDPQGLKMSTAFFPLLLGGMIGGIAISLLVVGSMRRVVGVLVYAVVGGLALAAVLEGWFGSVQGGFWVDAAAFALALGAIAAPIVGFVALVGRAGIALGPVVMMLFANPISGATLPSSFLPGSWGAVGQWFPPGASATLVRDLSYFPQADATFPWLVLACWAVGGLLLAVVGHFRTAGGTEPDAVAAHEDDTVPESAPEAVTA